MDHGITGYFAEQARFARRVTLVTVGVGVVGLGGLWAGRSHPVQQALHDTVRFGFEGRDQYVRRISLEQYAGTGPAIEAVGHVERMGTHGGAPREPSHRGPRQVRKPRLPEVGDANASFAGQRSSRQPNVRVVQSEDLTFLYKVTPDYPAGPFEQGIEGRVKFEGLVDTLGRVVELDLIECQGDPQFQQAASEAILQFRFVPY